MAENPLLPNRKLRKLLALTAEYQRLERAAKTHNAMAREALLAAAAMHLVPGDLLAVEAADVVAARIAPVPKAKTLKSVVDTPGASTLMVCAATAAGMRTAGTESLSLALLHAGARDAEWRQALAWAQTELLPLVTVCIDDTTRRRAVRGAFEEQAVMTFARRVRYPVITVDGQDAVAMYRVMQECVQRARTGCGPALVWAVCPPRMQGGATPLARLRQYMKVRGIPA